MAAAAKTARKAQTFEKRGEKVVATNGKSKGGEVGGRLPGGRETGPN